MTDEPTSSELAVKAARAAAESIEIARIEQLETANRESERRILSAVHEMVDGIGKRLDHHAEADKKFQDRMEPMVKVFENNNITRMVVRDRTSTIVFYLKSVSIIGSSLLAVIWLIRLLTTKQ